jgi:hypothetical protein
MYCAHQRVLMQDCLHFGESGTQRVGESTGRISVAVEKADRFWKILKMRAGLEGRHYTFR